MSKVATEFRFNQSGVSINNYDSSKSNLGSLMRIKSGATEADFYAGPHPIAVNRIGNLASTASTTHIIPWSDRYNWVFTLDNTTAGTSRRINYLIHDKQLDILSYEGFITCNFTLGGNKTIRGLRSYQWLYTGGSVSVSGTGVFGSGTSFTSHNVAAGSRIGFGTNDPTQVSSWYEIATSGIASNTFLGLTTPAPTYSSGTPYVIEELNIAMTITNSTTANAGLFLLKGLRPEIFTPGGTNINDLGINSDDLRGIYWLSDNTGAINANVIACGLASDPDGSITGQYVYVLNNTTNPNIFKYDIRRPLTVLGTGRSISAFLYATTGSAVVGTVSQANNGRIATALHGPGAGTKSFYFVTTSNIYRAAESNITSGASGWFSDTMAENPPGTVNTFALTSTLSQIDYSDPLDLFYVSTSNNRLYGTKYATDGSQFNHILLADTKQLDNTSEDARAYPFPSLTSSPIYLWTEGGYSYMTRSSTTSTTNQIYIVPLGVDWDYASSTQQRIITPKLNTPGASKFYRVYVNDANYLGSGPLTMPTEPYRIYVRTNGIDDNAGSWTLLDDTHSLTSIAASDEIQFMFEFRMFGPLSIPSRIYGLTVIYEDASTDSHYQPSVANSDITNKRFAWRHATAFGSGVPPLRVRLYDAVNSNLLVDDNTSSPAGTFERSITSGASWASWTSGDKENEGTYVRYTPASLGDNIKVRALLNQL